MNNHKICICIPTLNRFDLLLPALLYYKLETPNVYIFIYDNGKQRIKERLHDLINGRGNKRTYPHLIEKVTVLGNVDKNIGVSAAWNILLRKAFEEHSHALVLNDDILYIQDSFRMGLFMDNEVIFKSALFTCESKFDWSVFLMPRKTFETVGEFDERMVLYYSDNDYARRIKLGQQEVEEMPFLNPQLFRRSMSLLKDSTLNKQIVSDRDEYVKKWGGLPGEEKHLQPYNESVI